MVVALGRRKEQERPEPPVGLIEIEGLAMNGLLSQFSIEECPGAKGYKRIVAVDVSGRRLATGCIEEEAVNRQALVLNMYLRLWGKLINKG